ncbi:MAG: D-alanyl-D-alanine carboxypeptidase [Gemmatimonadetes bacterium]|nr:D-alanyl-D-alanine carboxypeptidase [Gemmatimonadota bacterium]
MVADPKFRSAQLGILVVDPTTGDTLVSHNAGKLFIPASNQKILTGPRRCTCWGPTSASARPSPPRARSSMARSAATSW